MAREDNTDNLVPWTCGGRRTCYNTVYITPEKQTMLQTGGGAGHSAPKCEDCKRADNDGNEQEMPDPIQINFEPSGSTEDQSEPQRETEVDSFLSTEFGEDDDDGENSFLADEFGP